MTAFKLLMALSFLKVEAQWPEGHVQDACMEGEPGFSQYENPDCKHVCNTANHPQSWGWCKDGF